MESNFELAGTELNSKIVLEEYIVSSMTINAHMGGYFSIPLKSGYIPISCFGSFSGTGDASISPLNPVLAESDANKYNVRLLNTYSSVLTISGTVTVVWLKRSN